MSEPSLDPEAPFARVARELLDASPHVEAAAPTLLPTETESSHPSLPLEIEETATPSTAHAPTKVLWRPDVPRKLGAYQLLEELGHGGMGIVYRARHERLGTLFAVKVLIAGAGASPEAIARFQREAAAVAKLGKHPHIVTVHDLGQQGGLAYYAMDLVEGKSLSRRLRERAHAPEEAALLLEKVARALHFAHEHGIIHRDVKPDNILVRDDGEPQVMDFGLARDVSSSMTLTVTGDVMGSPSYMAPEQVRGDVHATDARTDVYALGAVLYEVLTGALAHPGHAVAQVFEGILRGEVVPPRRIRPAVPRDIETICLKCLAPEPARRYQTAEALADDLGRFRRQEPILARRVGVAERLWKRVRRNPLATSLTAGLGLAVVAVCGVIWFFALRPEWRKAEAERRVLEEQARRRAGAGRLLEQARGAFAHGDPGAAETLATKLINDYERYARKGEALPISDAHSVLADIARGRGNFDVARLEFYRAFEAAIGTPNEAELLAEVGNQIIALGEFSRAAGVFRQVLEGRPDARVSSVANWGLARVQVAVMDFQGAAASLDAFDGDAPGARPGERDELGRFVSLMRPMREVPLTAENFVAADLDGDGTAELVILATDHRRIDVGHVRECEFQRTASILDVSDGTFDLEGLDAFDIDGDGKSEILVAGGNAERGSVAILRLQGDAIEVIARAELPGAVYARPFAAADLDGDGKREIAVGTVREGRKGVFLYHCDLPSRELRPMAELPLDGDVWRIVPCDANGDGVSELWACVGPWRGYELCCVRYDRSSETLVKGAPIRFAKEYSVAPVEEEGRIREFVVGAQWTKDSSGPLEEVLGKRAFRETYRAPGIYSVRPRPDGSAEVTSVWAGEFPGEGERRGTACMLSAGRTRFLWAAIAGERGDSLTRPSLGLFVRDGTGWRRLTDLIPSGEEFVAPYACDLDQDGDSEILFQRHDSILVCGLGEPTHVPPSSLVPGSEASRPFSTGDMIAARGAEAAGLDAEAAEAYTRALAGARTLEEAECEARGLLLALTRQGKFEEAGRTMASILGRLPQLRAALARTLLDALEAAGQWDGAAKALEQLETAPAIAPEELMQLARRKKSLLELARPRPSFELHHAIGSCTLLATSPFCASLADDGALTLVACADGQDGLFIPLVYDGGSYRLRATLDIVREDWGTNLAVGLVGGEPWTWGEDGGQDPAVSLPVPRKSCLQALDLSSHGESISPTRSWDLRWVGRGRDGRRRILSDLPVPDPPAAPPRVGVTLEYAAHRQELRCRVQAPQIDRSGFYPLTVLGESDPYLSLLGYGSSGGENWLEVRLTELVLETGGEGSKTIERLPGRGIEHLFLANGLWIQGRLKDARTHYDRAIELSKLEEAREQGMRDQGFPSALDTPWAQAFLKWTRVDALFWRGLLLAETEEAEAGAADLTAARSLSADRFARLVSSHALGLGSHPRAAKGLRAFLLREGGVAESAEVTSAGNLLLKKWGPEVAHALLAGTGYGVTRRQRVSSVVGSRSEDSAREGDFLLSYDGVPIASYGALRRAQGAALDAAKGAVEVRVERADAVLRLSLDPSRVRLVTEEECSVAPATR